MKFAIRLSCVLAVICCLVSTGNTGAIDQDLQRLQELQRRSEGNSDPSTQVEITYEAVELYKKYRGQEESDAAKESELNSQVDQFESKIVLVEGVPKQGGGFTNFFTSMFSRKKNNKANKDHKESPAQTIVTSITKYVLGKVMEKLEN